MLFYGDPQVTPKPFNRSTQYMQHVTFKTIYFGMCRAEIVLISAAVALPFIGEI
jgi:hypothetical protein